MKTRVSLLLLIAMATVISIACNSSSSIRTVAATGKPFVKTTALASPSATAVPCFFTYFDPFAILPGTSQLLVCASGSFQIFDLESMHETQFFTVPTHLNGPAIAVSPYGSMFAWAPEQCTIEWYRFSGLKKLANIHSRQFGLINFVFSPDSSTLV